MKNASWAMQEVCFPFYIQSVHSFSVHGITKRANRSMFIPHFILCLRKFKFIGPRNKLLKTILTKPAFISRYIPGIRLVIHTLLPSHYKHCFPEFISICILCCLHVICNRKIAWHIQTRFNALQNILNPYLPTCM